MKLRVLSAGRYHAAGISSLFDRHPTSKIEIVTITKVSKGKEV
jgi:hypothetical protein